MIYQAYTWKHSFHDFEKVLKIIEESKTIQNPD